MNLFCVRPKRFNVGNATIDMALRRLLREVLPSSVNLVPVPAIESEEEGSLSGLGPRTVHEMNLYGHGVLVGGGNLYENGQLTVDENALACLRPPLLLCSLSHGRIYDHRHRLRRRTDSMPDAVIAALNAKAVRSLARDDATLDYLHDLGFDDVRLAGCPTLFLGKGEQRADGSGALISIRNPSLMSVPLADQVRVQADIRRIAAALEAEGFGPVRLLCHDKRDLPFAASFGDVEYLLPDDVSSYLDLLRGARVVVSFRLHAFLPCVSLGIPAVNLSYDERSLASVRTIGLEEWDIDYVREPDAVEAVRDRIARLDELTALRDSARPVWDELERTTRDALVAFAEDMVTYAADYAPTESK